MNSLLVLMALLPSPQCPPDPLNALPEESARGFATDRPSYSPGETIQIYGNWDPAQWTSVEYKLKRLDRSSNAFEVPVSIPSIQSSGAVTPVSREVAYGSFVDFPTSPKPGGRLRFTIEGWFLPTWVPGLPPPELSLENPPSISDDVLVLAGQIGLAPGITDPDAQPLEQTIAGPGGIGIDATGTLFGAVTVGGSLHVVYDDAPLVADGTLDSSDWHYVGLTYDGAAGVLRLYVDGQVADTGVGVVGLRRLRRDDLPLGRPVRGSG
jgi:hypothetical protein